MEPVTTVVLTLTLAAAAVWDVRVRRIPNALVATAGAVLLAADAAELSPLATLARAGVAVVVLALWLLVPTGMGAGDAKLFAVAALAGGPVLVLLLFAGAALTMTLYAAARWALALGRVGFGGALPMAPFMAAVWAVALVAAAFDTHRGA
jgi:Flp pilus assembly protein protease CpaA